MISSPEVKKKKKIIVKKNSKVMVSSTIKTFSKDNLNELFSFVRNRNVLEDEPCIDSNLCPYCDNIEIIINNDGLLVCRECALTFDKVIDQTAEWRYYGYNDNKNSDPTRCGMPINSLLPQSSMGSVISSVGKHDTYEMKKIRQYHTWNSIPYKERALSNVFDIFLVALNNGISPCIIEESKSMYKQISEFKISRGSTRKGLIASCVYMACKKLSVPRSAKEIADIFTIDITIMTNGCKNFIEIWNMKNKNQTGNIVLNACQSDDFINRFCSNLNLSSEILKLSSSISEKAEQYSLVSENTPPSIAAGSIYLACKFYDMNISKKDISDVCKISEVTISKCYKKLLKFKEYLIPI